MDFRDLSDRRMLVAMILSMGVECQTGGGSPPEQSLTSCWTITADPNAQEFGAAMNVVGDWDGDHMPDIAISSPSYGDGGGPGIVRMYSITTGRQSGSLRSGLEYHDRFGEVLCSNAKLGLLAVGAPGITSVPDGGGGVFLFRNGEERPSLILKGTGADDYFGRAIAFVPFNQENSNYELAVGSPGIEGAQGIDGGIKCFSLPGGTPEQAIPGEQEEQLGRELLALKTLKGELTGGFVACGRQSVSVFTKRPHKRIQTMSYHSWLPHLAKQDPPLDVNADNYPDLIVWYTHEHFKDEAYRLIIYSGKDWSVIVDRELVIRSCSTVSCVESAMPKLAVGNWEDVRAYGLPSFQPLWSIRGSSQMSYGEMFLNLGCAIENGPRVLALGSRKVPGGGAVMVVEAFR